MSDEFPIISKWSNSIQNMDCVAGMKELPDDSIDLVIADPPYNLSKGNDWAWENEVDIDGFGGAWNKTMENWDDLPLGEYIQFTGSWLEQVQRITKPTGSIWTFGSYHNIGIINTVHQLLGIEILNEIIWFKRNAFPNLSGRRFTASHENILWAHVGGADNREYSFNYEELKEMEFPEDNLNHGGKQVRTVWDIPNNKSKEERKYGDHPTQKPLRVLERIVKATATKGDLCLVPFCGSGSACVSAKLNGLDYIGFEVEEEYVNLAKERLENASSKPPSVKNTCVQPQTKLSDDYE